MKVLIVVHGTSQDSSSLKENTVQLASAARLAGFLVIEIGGPGSTERTLMNMAEFDLIAPVETPDDALGYFTHYGLDQARGVMMGHGVDAIVRDIKKAVIGGMKVGASEINIVGFSRGAVSVALSVEQIGKEMGPGFYSPVPIRIMLLDPVPGPLRIKQSVEIPRFIERCVHYVSKHEGRPGFGHLDVSIDPSVFYRGEIVTGVHGDIGGSTQSGVSRLVLSDMGEEFGIPSVVLPPSDQLPIIIDAMVEPWQYSYQGIMQSMSRRAIGWSGADHEQGAIILPTHRSTDVLQQMRNTQQMVDLAAFFARQALERERRLREQLRAMEQRMMEERLIREMMERRIVVPTRPVPNPSNTIVFPPSSSRGLGSLMSRDTMIKGAKAVLSFVFKKKF